MHQHHEGMSKGVRLHVKYCNMCAGSPAAGQVCNSGVETGGGGRRDALPGCGRSRRPAQVSILSISISKLVVGGLHPSCMLNLRPTAVLHIRRARLPLILGTL